MSELSRLVELEFLDLPGTGLAISIYPKPHNNSIDRLKEVVRCVITIEGKDYSLDEVWIKNLPDWFVKKANSYSQEEVLLNEQVWDFGSWIDGMKFRGWRWWSVKRNAETTNIYLETVSFPYNIDPFFFVTYLVGVDKEDIQVKEIFPGSNNLELT